MEDGHSGLKSKTMAIADFSGKKVLICYIEKSMNELIYGKPWRHTLLDCVCKYWDIPSVVKANEADFVIGVNAEKIISVVAKPDQNGWQKVSAFPKLRNEVKDKKLLERFAFEGNDISKTPEAAPYIGKTLSGHIKFVKDISYPLYCINGEIINWQS